MRSQRFKKIGFVTGFVVCLGLLVLAAPGLAQAGPFTRLQVLLPGEVAAPGTPTGKTGAAEAQTVGVPFTVVVRACDDDWNTVSEVTDAVSWNSTDESADLPATGQMTLGRLEAVVTFNAAGTFTISGQDLSDSTVDEAFSSNVVSVILAGFRFEDINQKHHDAGVPFTIEITAVDPSDNAVGGYTGPVSLEQMTSYGPGRISPESVTLDGGVWRGQVTLFRADETNINRGNVNIYAYLSGDTSINGSSNPFLVHPAAFGRILMVLPGQTHVPGSVAGVTGAPASQGATQPFSVNLYSTDAYWNFVSSNDVFRIVSSDPGASTPVTASLTSGEAVVSLFLATVGAQTLTVNDLSDGSITPMTTAPTMVIPSYAHHFEFDPLPVSIVAGSAVLVTIRAADAGGNTIPDFAGDAILSANTGPGSISPSDVTFTNGVWIGPMQFFGAGAAVQVTCADYATPPHQGSSDPALVLPGPYVATQLILPGQVPLGGTEAGLAGVPEDQDAGQAFSVQVRAVDQYFNRVTGIDNPLNVVSPDPNIDVPDGISLVNGEAIFPVTIYMAGSQTLAFADASSSSIEAGASSDFVVIPGPYAKLLLIAPGETAEPGDPVGRVGTATDQSITYLFTVTALATDEWYNQVRGISDVVHLDCTDPGAELSHDKNLEDGVAFLGVRLATGGYQQITLSSVSTPSVAISTTQVRAISSGLHIEAGIAETAVSAGVPFTLNVRMVNDAGSVIQEINSEMRVAVRNAVTQEAGRGVLSATSFQLLQGQRTVSLEYTYAEPIVLEISDASDSTPGLTGALDVQPGPPAVLALSSDPGWVRANRVAVIIANVGDEFGNPIPNQSVTFATAAGDSGSLQGHESDSDSKSVVGVTDADGNARADYLSPRFAQIAHVIASSGSLTAEYDLETALVAPDAAGGHITSYPNPFHPDETDVTIAYVLDDAASVHVRIYTLSGGLVLDRRHPAADNGGSAGLNEIKWDGCNGNGDPVASGGYILYVEAEGTGATQHVMRRKIGVVW